MDTIKTFSIVENGLEMQVEVSWSELNHCYEAKVTALEGHADVNALFWADVILDGSSFKLAGKADSSLNMNGSGMDWDGGQKFSSAGLGNDPSGLDTFIDANNSADNSITLSLSSMTLEQFESLQYIGVRATSTSTPEGSIKAVAEVLPQVEEPEPAGHFPDFKDVYGSDISNAVFYFQSNDADGVYTVKIDSWPDGENDTCYPSQDMDTYLATMVNYIAANSDIVNEDSVLLGVALKGGQTTEYFALDNNIDANSLPEGVQFIVKDALNESYDFGVVIDNCLVA